MKKTLFFVIFCFWTFTSNAQDILYSTSYYNISATNPAFAGARKTFNLTALLGNRFNGTITPQQVSQVFSLDGQLISRYDSIKIANAKLRQTNDGNKLMINASEEPDDTVAHHATGLGLQAFNNNIANQNQQGVAVDYAYRLLFGQSMALAIGIRGGFTYQSAYVGLNSGLTRFFPYAGLGALLHSETFFLSVSKPVIITKQVDYLFVNEKPLFISGGISLAAGDNLMLNPMVLYEVNDQSGNAIMATAKLWFSKKFALGGTYKSRSASSLINRAAYSKVIGSFEAQVSKSIRLGLSYDNNPYSDFEVSGNTYGTGGIFQILFRYESVSDKENGNRLRFF